MNERSGRSRNARFSWGLEAQEPDGLLALIGAYRNDQRIDKIDVGLGVYRDAAGRTPVFAAVKQAERQLLEQQDSKGYLGPRGNAEFLASLGAMVLGTTLAESDRVAAYQAPGGGGALRLGAELIARSGRHRTVWVSEPTWPNHHALLDALDLPRRSHRLIDPATLDLDIDAMLEDMRGARAGDVWLIHAVCHNPTGVSFTSNHWRRMIDVITERELIPFIDLAYHGLGNGLETDAAGVRMVLEACLEVIVAYSCDKNFGLYRERTGALWVQAADAASARICDANLSAIGQGSWSMPPDHGAAVVAAILSSPDLSALWLRELNEMQMRLRDIRTRLADAHPALAAARRHGGLFMKLPIGAEAVTALQRDHAIYMAPDGRINVSGLSEGKFERFVAAVTPLLGTFQARELTA